MVKVGNVNLPVRALIGALSIAVSVGSAAAQNAPPTSKARITVDFAAPRGPLLRAERFNNLYPSDQYQAVLAPDVAFMNAQGLHGQIYRVWVSDINFNPKTGHSDPNLIGIFDPKTGKYDFDSVAPYLDQASRISDSLLVALNLQSMVRAGWAPAQTKPVIKTIIFELKRRFPKIEYIEAFNEPDYQFAKTMKPEDFYSYYKPYYEAVDEVNAELRPTVPLKIGGPALTMFRLPWLTAFLDSYKADPARNKRLDFISYHAYGAFDFSSTNGVKARMYKQDPSEVGRFRAQLDAELQARGLDTNIPSFITEIGPYPGPSYDSREDPRPDYLRQAAAVASFTYWFMESPKNVPFQWMLRHDTNGRKDQLVAHAPVGEPVRTDVFTPYGNSLVMLSKMKAKRVSAVSDGLKGGKGAYVIAAEDASGLSVMVWNYQWTGTDRVRVDIDLSGLPARLRDTPLRERVFRIDAATSNYFADPGKADLQMVSERMVTGARTMRETAELEPNALQLILLEPQETAPKRMK